MSRAEHIATGQKGENLAAQFLEFNGYVILERNYRFSGAEVDIVCLKGTELVFVEVKTRTGLRGDYYPEMAVTPAKQKHCIRAADAFVYEKKMWTVPVRFDVIAIRLSEGHEPEIVHFPDAFRADDTLQADIDFWKED